MNRFNTERERKVAGCIQPKFAVGIPACNEEQLVRRSIESVLNAADALRDPRALRLVIACDSCTDETRSIAKEMAFRDGRVDAIEGNWRSAGACRAAAIRRAISGEGDRTSLTNIWVATTDADTVVPVDWLTQHATHWARGDHAVAGVVDLLDVERGDDSVELVEHFTRRYTLGHDSHGHVHGANLGVRADAYVSVGGFPSVDLAEDHALWHNLRRAGFVCRSSVSLRVATSARLVGRAAGGFADGLREAMIGRSATV